jgi:protein-S-isoprenylcysteine O-methyltransferase Ste14
MAFICLGCGNIGLGSSTFFMLAIGVLVTLVLIWLIYWLIRQMGRG